MEEEEKEKKKKKPNPLDEDEEEEEDNEKDYDDDFGEIQLSGDGISFKGSFKKAEPVIEKLLSNKTLQTHLKSGSQLKTFKALSSHFADFCG